MQTIAIVNQKGGVGKSTTAVNLGAGLVRQGKRVLLIDADSQANLTEMLGWQQPDELSPTLATMLERIISDQPIQPQDGILHHKEGMDLLPANIELSGLEVSLVNTMSRETVLRTYLNEVKRQYDYMIIGGFVQKSMLKAVVQHRHINAARQEIRRHAAVVWVTFWQQEFRRGVLFFSLCLRLLRMGIKKAALLIDELHGIGEFHLFNFDEIVQRVDAAHLVVGPPAPFTVGQLQAVVAAELVGSVTGGDQLIGFIVLEKGQQIGLTGALDLCLGCIRHCVHS